jgi:hypothetical protein
MRPSCDDAKHGRTTRTTLHSLPIREFADRDSLGVALGGPAGPAPPRGEENVFGSTVDVANIETTSRFPSFAGIFSVIPDFRPHHGTGTILKRSGEKLRNLCKSPRSDR